VVAETVSTALRALVAAQEPGQIPQGAGIDPEAQTDDEETEDVEEDGRPEEAHEVFDRSSMVRGILDDISIAIGAGNIIEARRLSSELVEEADQLAQAIDALQAVTS
jgi:hypothetical protein